VRDKLSPQQSIIMTRQLTPSQAKSNYYTVYRSH